jgi:hypothetical protein
MRRSQPLTIGQKSFETRKAADRFVEHLLYDQPLKVAIREPLHSFLRALLSMHPHAEEKVGKGIGHFTVENSVRGGRCFCLTRIDGTKTDFRFYECVAGRQRRTETGWTTTHKPNCWICGRPVSIRDSKIDESGFSVHEKCIMAKLALEKGQSQESEAVKVAPPMEQS